MTHVINAKQLVLHNTDNTNSTDDVILKSHGGKGVQDVNVQQTNFKFNESDVILQNGDLKCTSIKHTGGNNMLTFTDSTINFHNNAVQNINLGTGSITASTVAATTGSGFSSLEAEITDIENSKLDTHSNTYTGSRLLATSAGKYIGETTIPSTLPTTNQTNITTLDGEVVKKTGDQDIAGTKNFTGILMASSGNLKLLNNGVLVNLTHSANSSIDIQMPSSTGTLSLAAPVTTNANAISALQTTTSGHTTTIGQNTTRSQANETDITALQTTTAGHTTTIGQNTTRSQANETDITALQTTTAGHTTSIATNATNITSNTNNKLALAGGTMTGDLRIDATLGLGAAPSHNLTITDTSETFCVNHNPGFTPNAYYVGTTTATDVKIGTSNTARITIQSGGIVNIDSYKLYVGDIQLRDTNEINCSSGLYLNDEGDNTFICRNGGTLTVGSTVVSSDDRLKHNETEIDNALEIIAQLTPKKYFKTATFHSSDTNFEKNDEGDYVDINGQVVAGQMNAGVIAQELLDTNLAYLVKGGYTTTKGEEEIEIPYAVNYNGLIAYLIKGMQELKQENEALHKNLKYEMSKTTYLEMKVNEICNHLDL